MSDPVSPPQSGYTLPVFACAAAVAALRWLEEDRFPLTSVSIDLIEPSETVEIAIEQIALLSDTAALAISRSDPGDNLDLTRDTPVWALVELMPEGSDLIVIRGGEGIGKQIHANHQPAIYDYAQRLLHYNLAAWLPPETAIQVTIILPQGRSLATRTSNAAFGVVEGLSLLGTSGIAQPLSAPGQLELFRQELQQRANRNDGLVFCIGENGLDLAEQQGISADRLIKTANWLGSMLVEAGLQGVRSVLLFGYHGKLIKLAGGIFHTHHHVADGRQEILAAHCANLGLPTLDVQAVFSSSTTEAALQYLRKLDAVEGSHWVDQVYGSIAEQIDRRAAAYIQIHCSQLVQVGSVLFDRDRQILVQSKIGATLLHRFVNLD